MALSSGVRVGPYEILSALGAGGMGEVYRARDGTLQRDVALKILPEQFALDSDRLARFRREAQVLASLNHPNIAAIYGFEESTRVHALVLELVEGPTLADRIEQGAIPVDEALPMARQIAEALEAAHEHGIIHRDLKPANIKVRPDGAVKVLDFGLAKLAHAHATGEARRSDALSLSPTITSPALMTGVGMILGTAAYMSPEQAKGREANKRSDVWAFGCVLYEMLTGRRAFEGEDVADTLASVLKQDPDWTKLPTDLAAPIRTLLQQCVVKDPRKRIAELSTALFIVDHATTLSTSFEMGSAVSSGAVTRSRRCKQLAWIGAGIGLTALVAVGALAREGYIFDGAPDAGAYRSTYDVPAGLRLGRASPTGAFGRFALAPDGRRLAFVATDVNGRTQLWVRSLDTAAVEPLAGTDGAGYPFWSPDSRSIAFVAQNALKKIAVSGGPAVPISEPASDGRGSWNADDVILFNMTAGGLGRVSATEGASAAIAVSLGDGEQGLPFFLPNNRHFLYTARGADNRTVGVYVGSLDPAEESRLLLSGAAGAMYAQGHLIFQRGTALMTQAFDVRRRELIGDAVPLAGAIDVTGGLGNAGAFSVSGAGVLAFQSGIDDARSQLLWIDRNDTQLTALGEAADQVGPELSPDGTSAAVSLLDPAKGTRDLWIYDVGRGVKTRFTDGPADELNPIWSPDGTRLAYGSTQNGPLDLYQRAVAAGPGQEQALLEGPGNKYLTSWSRDGFLMFFNGVGGSPRTLQDLWILPLVGSTRPTAFVETEAAETYGRFSSDGRWVAYASDETGRREVYVAPFPGPGETLQVSTAGGTQPRWRRDGEELFCLTDNHVTAAKVNGKAAAFTVGAEETLFETRYRIQDDRGFSPGSGYDVSADGQRFLVNMPMGQQTAVPITLIHNWTAGLKE
jgi:Tol biopolymer transport system component/tRNA A-37 threonylcarbamoyl transferase component Bud32